MKKEDLKITRYEIEKGKEKYLLYLIPEDNVLSFYIQKVGYGDLYHTVGLLSDKVPEDIEILINNNIENWISLAEEKNNIIE